MAFKFNPLSGQFDLVDPSKWTTNSPGIKYPGHIAVGANAGVDAIGSSNVLLGSTVSANTLNQETSTNVTATNVLGILNNLIANPGSNTSQNWIGQDGIVEVASTNATNFSGSVVGDVGGAYHYGSGTISLLAGLESIVANTGTGILSAAHGTRNVAIFQPTGVASVGNYYGTSVLGISYPNHTITNFYGSYLANSIMVGGTITNHYGLYVENQTSGSTINYNIYSAGAASNNFLGGKLAISTAGALADWSTNHKLVVNPNTTADTSANVQLNASAATAKPLVVQGVASQSGNLIEMQNNSGTMLAQFGSTGKLSIGNSALGSNCLDVYTASSGNIATYQSNGATAGGKLVAYILGNTVAGNVYGFHTSGSTSSGALLNTIQQNDNGNAVFEALVLGTGDAQALFDINGGQSWSVGLDNSDSDAFVISGASTLGTSNGLRIDTSQNITTYGNVTITDAKNIILNSTTGTKIGTATTQKLGFFNATPVVQQTSDINSLVTYGLLASISNATFTKETAATIKVDDSTTTNTAGAALSILAGKGKASAVGGALNLTGGSSDTAGAGGAVNITGGTGTNLSAGGAVNIIGGNGFNGGSVKIDVGGGFAGAKVLVGTVRSVQTGFVQSSPTAWIHIGAGTATANTAPLKFTTGTNLTTAEAGAMEYSSNVLYFTPSGTNRYAVLLSTIPDAQDITFGTTTGTKIGTATSQKIGLWNATPIVQPTTAIAAATFTANTSGIVNDSATWDGYTIGQVVKALRNIGALA